MRRYRIASIPGDGIGKEVLPAACKVLDKVAALHGFALEYSQFDWSCETYLRIGRMMPEDGISRLSDHDAIFLGAVGFPGVPDHVSLWGLLIPIRREFDQYVNLRPVRLLPGIVPLLANKAIGEIDYWIVRENTEGEYSQDGGVRDEGGENERAEQLATFTRKGTDRIIRYAFELALSRGLRRVTSGTKSNGIYHSMPYWDSRFAKIAEQFPNIETESDHIDILAARLVMRPEHYQVIVASNLFGDILSDLGPATTGTIAVAPSANINPEKRYPSMFEPVHGSAPDICGRGIANPIGQIWSGAMMFEHLGEAEAGAMVMRAVEAVLGSEDGPKTPDIGGKAATGDVVAAILDDLG